MDNIVKVFLTFIGVVLLGIIYRLLDDQSVVQDVVYKTIATRPQKISHTGTNQWIIDLAVAVPNASIYTDVGYKTIATRPPNISHTGTNQWIIDLDVAVPTVDELYERLVLVLPFSENHYREAMGFIETAQKYMLGKKIIIYDLGMSKEQRAMVQTICNVEVRDFPFSKYPKYVEDLYTYAFKPILVNEVLREYGVVQYGDASIRFHASIRDLFKGIEHHHGFMSIINGFDVQRDRESRSRYNLTVPEMFDWFGIDREEYFAAKESATNIEPGTLLFVNSTTIQNKLMQPWLQCALDKACIAPEGSSRKNHRQDASAIALVVYKYMRNEWTRKDNDRKRLKLVVDVQRDTYGNITNLKYCHT